ncbi:uncharacterized protein EV420DRAFT_1565482 [Desarmillaria tabescens]|uniref:Uncharacterized protein n=1 Tax=Armillaria tabescens TaxID=1929756 RepID=A0AA39JU89_ARMTA|nr:uncharacterized protein EV420DRAFT_1565482 [Desarmillaria tabescens]KAK0449016.1 hypothetical protein EV420DRAFT_1565482 [Desarmillaria tabescens]
MGILFSILAPLVKILESLTIAGGSTNLRDYDAYPQEETRTTVDSTLLKPRAEAPAFSHPPSGWTAQSTRIYTRPCRCGKSACRWRFFYLDRMIFATHEVLDSLEAKFPLSPTTRNAMGIANLPAPRLNSRQKESFFLSTIEGPKFSFHKTFAVPVFRRGCGESGLFRFLEREPWADTRQGKPVCLGCGAT